jgi:hypothetical protein
MTEITTLGKVDYPKVASCLQPLAGSPPRHDSVHALKAIGVDDAGTHHLLIGLNRENIDALLNGDVLTLPGGRAAHHGQRDRAGVCRDGRRPRPQVRAEDADHIATSSSPWRTYYLKLTVMRTP